MHRILSGCPFLPFFIAYVVGIILSDGFLDQSSILVAISLQAVFIILLLIVRIPYIQQYLLFPPFLLAGICHHQLHQRHLAVELPQRYAVYEAVIVGEPVEKAKATTAEVQILNEGEYIGRRVRATFMKDTASVSPHKLSIGDGVIMRCLLRRPENFVMPGEASHFDYVRYLQIRDISLVAFVGHGDWTTATLSLSPLSILDRARLAVLKFRSSIINRLERLGLEGQSLAVAAAMSLGDKSELSSSTKDMYSLTGASHILALSGTHLGIIYFLLSFLGGRSRLRPFREFSILFAVWSYVFLVGMSPSVVRSALMITVCSFAYLTFRDRNGINSILLSASIMIVVNPVVIFDAGFLMSYSAVLSIILIARPVTELIPIAFRRRHRIFDYFWRLTSVSCAAQLGTAPLVAYFFGRLPVYFLLANYVVMPATVVVLYLSLLCVTVLPFAPVVSLLSFAIDTLNSFLGFVAALPMSSIGGIRVSILQVVLLYSIIVAACLWLYIEYFRWRNYYDDKTSNYI